MLPCNSLHINDLPPLFSMTSVTLLSWFAGVICGLMSEKDLSAGTTPQGASRELDPGVASGQGDSSSTTAQTTMSPAHYNDLQSAARFPIKLPIHLKLQSGENQTETQNISSNGVLFRVDSEMPVGAPVDFTISLPAEIVGAAVDVQVDCRGRVVRSFSDEGRRGVGVVIDEYRFERR
jgi:hypothetical protein